MMDKTYLNSKLEELLLKNPGVNKINYGKKQISGSLTEEDSFVFEVTEKKLLDQLTEEEIIPSVILSGSKEIKTDVVQAAPVFCLSSLDFLTTATDISGSTVTLAISVDDSDPNMLIYNVELQDTSRPYTFTEKEMELITERVHIEATKLRATGETSGILTLSIPSECPEECYKFRSLGIQTTFYLLNTVRPFRAGLQVQSEDLGGSGTAGLIARDAYTNALVGVTNAHVVTSRPLTPSAYPANYVYTDTARFSLVGNSTPTGITPAGNDKELGPVVRFVPLDPSSVNRVDGAVFVLPSTAIDNSLSYKQFGTANYYENGPFPEDADYAITYATTAEIDSIDNTTELASVGRTTGCKEGVCGLRLLSLNNAVNVQGYGSFGDIIPFSPVISFTRINPNCPSPVAGGDSGSSLLAKFGDTWKVVGLVFAGGNNIGYACRIDHVVEELGISVWDGSSPSYINPSSLKSFTVDGVTDARTLNVAGTTYYNMGKTLIPGNQN